jgi:hypothetical protein
MRSRDGPRGRFRPSGQQTAAKLAAGIPAPDAAARPVRQRAAVAPLRIVSCEVDQLPGGLAPSLHHG